MRVGLRFDLRQAREWHGRLIDRLIESGYEPIIVHHETSQVSPWPDRLLAFEARLRGSRFTAVAARIGQEALLGRGRNASPQLLLDLDSDGRDQGNVPVWHLTADDAPGISALLRAAALQRTPTVAVRQGGAVLAAGRVGTESPGLLGETVADLLGRTTTLILSALAGRVPCAPDLVPMSHPDITAAHAARLAAGMAVRRLSRRIHRLAYRTPHWRVGWRRLEEPDLFELRRHPAGGWNDLPDDGRHFYADPFPILYRGEVTLFVEDYVHATGRGRISAVAFGPDGPRGRPEPVLECSFHLSYPFVFIRDGDVWMIPESGEAETIDLYRATRFPGGWVKEATLVGGLVAGDATLYEAPDGTWWMFATVKDGGAASDALHLWTAPDFRGPWIPHAKNPVLIDIASARPAGHMIVRDGMLLRPVQDCRNGYGAALGIARVNQLDDHGFSQELETTIMPGLAWHGACLHTLNQAGDFEFIDGSGRARRSWREMFGG